MGRRNTDGNPQDMNAAVREQQVLALRLEGYDFDTIGTMTGYANGGGAYKAYKRALARIPAGEARELRQVMSLQLDQLIQATIPKARNGDLWAVDRVLAVMERQAKLFGLDIKPDSQVQLAQVLIREYPQAALEAV